MRYVPKMEGRKKTYLCSTTCHIQRINEKPTWDLQKKCTIVTRKNGLLSPEGSSHGDNNIKENKLVCYLGFVRRKYNFQIRSLTKYAPAAEQHLGLGETPQFASNSVLDIQTSSINFTRSG